jgi:hypothetical protein
VATGGDRDTTFFVPAKIKRVKEYNLALPDKTPSMRIFLERKNERKEITGRFFIELYVPLTPLQKLSHDSKFTLGIQSDSGQIIHIEKWRPSRTKGELIEGILFHIPHDKIPLLANARFTMNKILVSDNGKFKISSEEVIPDASKERYGLALPGRTKIRSGHRILVEDSNESYASNSFKVRRRVPIVVWIPPLIPITPLLIFIISVSITGYDM